MQLYFIRHGQSENNLAWQRNQSYEGRVPDPDLTRLGRQQAEIVAEFVSRNQPLPDDQKKDPANRIGFGFTHIYTSLLHRAVATADIVAGQLDLPMTAWPDLHEWGGIYELDIETDKRTGLPGKGREFFETHYPNLELPETMNEHGWWNRPWESFSQVPERAQRVIDQVIRRHGSSDDRIAMIGHAGFYNYLIAAVLGFSDEQALHGLKKPAWFVLNNVAITRIDFHEQNTALVYLNRTDHIPTDMLT